MIEKFRETHPGNSAIRSRAGHAGSIKEARNSFFGLSMIKGYFLTGFLATAITIVRL